MPAYLRKLGTADMNQPAAFFTFAVKAVLIAADSTFAHIFVAGAAAFVNDMLSDNTAFYHFFKMAVNRSRSYRHTRIPEMTAYIGGSHMSILYRFKIQQDLFKLSGFVTCFCVHAIHLCISMHLIIILIFDIISQAFPIVNMKMIIILNLLKKCGTTAYGKAVVPHFSFNGVLNSVEAKSAYLRNIYKILLKILIISVCNANIHSVQPVIIFSRVAVKCCGDMRAVV